MTTKHEVMYLVDDETVSLPIRGKNAPFRVRVWRAKKCPAVVVVSRAEGGPSPGSATCRVANYVLRAMLGYLPAGMDYFEANGDGVYLVTFEGIGTGHRLTLIRPERVEVSAEEIGSLVGSTVDL